MTEVLDEPGYAAIEAADGTSGLKVLQSDVRIDLLITDVGLPNGMNGRRRSELPPDAEGAVHTSYAENAAVGDGQLEPGMHLLTRPFAMEMLASRIKTVIAG